jgi:PAS domain S-box-containing protein
MMKKYRLVDGSAHQHLLLQNASQKEEIDLASQFITAIGLGTSSEWLEQQSDKAILENALIKQLTGLQQKLSAVAEEEKQRNWTAEGLAMFAQILRNNEENIEKLMNRLLSKIVTYIQANQGSLFVAEEQDGRTVLEQVACYAYGRTKYFQQTILPGEGLLGQTFLEKETIFLTDVPSDYVSITSGLGEATPNCLVIVPLKVNEKVVGLLELASFYIFPPHVVEFLERLAENTASAIANVKIAQQTRKLLSETQQQTEMMKAQEEELRQNLEELQATQEEMLRKQRQLDQKNELIQLILNNLPIPVFVKDENASYTLVNKSEAELLGCTEKEILGKDDTFFTNNETERAEIKRSDIAALQSVKPIELPMQSFTTPAGKTHFFKTTKVSFLNSVTGKRNIIGISIDLTDRIKLEQKTLSEKVVQQNNVIIDLAGRQRMLSQKIGFYSEMVFRGQMQQAPTLRKAIDLHHHSLEILKVGGWPMEMEALVPLDKAHEALMPFIEKVENVWYPYKEAAEHLISIAIGQSLKKEDELEEAIKCIEDQGEALLKLNNQLLMQYKKITQKELEAIE